MVHTRNIFYSLFISSVFCFVIFAFAPQTHAQTPSSGTTQPSFFPLAPCPTCTNPSTEPVTTGTVVPSGVVAYPTAIKASGAPAETPCDSSIASDNARPSKHKKHKGAISSGMEALLKFLIELINMILKLLGGGQITSPQSPGETPTAAVPLPTSSTTLPTVGSVTSAVPSAPAANPCPSAAEPAPTSSQTEPTSPAVSGAAPSSGAQVPSTAPSSGQPAPSGAAQSIDLTNWYLGLPTGSAESPTNIKQPQLDSFTVDPWFIKNPDGSIRFRAAVNGVTTSGSDYPRSELREMKGSSEASWSSSTGTHTMEIDEAITAVPKTKKHVVAGQIHDASDDVIVIRLEMPKLFVDVGGTEGAVLDPNYTLGKRFKVKFEVTGGKTNVYYNGGTTPAHTITKSYSGAYFKAGAYTQSNCTTDPGDCSANNYGEVVIYSLTVTHK